MICLTQEDFDILFEPNPYSFESTVNPTLPVSPFVQVMRDQEARFYAAFPEARLFAERRQRRKADIIAFLAAQNDQQSHVYYYNDVPALVPAVPQQSSSSSSSSSEHYYPTTHDYYPPIAPRPSSQNHHHISHPALAIAVTPTTTTTTNTTAAKSPPYQNRRIRSRPSTPGPTTVTSSHKSRTAKTPKNGLAWCAKRRGAAATAAAAAAGAAARSNNNFPAGGSSAAGGAATGVVVPGKRQQSDRKPTLACLFCRGRKIACGQPLPGSIDKSCNQCQRRSLRCEFPVESRRGMRKRKALKAGDDESPDDQS